MCWLISFVILLFLTISNCNEISNVGNELYSIEGRVFAPDNFGGSLGNWQANTRILVNGGEYLGFLKSDGSFAITNVPSGSYLLEAVNADFAYEPVRVEINSKGRLRARKVNHIQTAQVVTVPYPLKMKAFTRFRYFQVREQWRVTDFLLNPMVLMMVLPLVLIMILPKLMNDPETRKELEQFNSSMKYEMPEISEIFSNMLSDKQKPKAVKASKKKSS